MSLRAISDSERLVHVYSGDPEVKFFYRRIPGNIRDAIVKRNTRIKRGVEIYDKDTAGKEFIEYALLGWDGFLAPDSEEQFPFSIDNFDKLPAKPVQEFTEALIDGVDYVKSEEAEKNSRTTRSSGS